MASAIAVVVLVAVTAVFLRSGGSPPPPDPSLPLTRPLTAVVPDGVTTVEPALRVTFPEPVDPDAVEAATSVPGVAAAARVLLANLTVEVPGGDADVSVAAVDPDEFRPLAPDATAQTKFVWEGLHRYETLIAHEQFPVFGGQELRTLAARGPAGRKILAIGGLASSGVPNLAGALMSLELAQELGLGEPRILLVGLAEEGGESAATMIEQALPGAMVEPLRSVQPKRFLAGASAQRAIGTFSYTTNEDGTISQDPSWVRRHIVTANVPLLGRVRCHRVLIPQLEGALNEIQQAGLAGVIKPSQYGGCHVPRFIDNDGTRPLSMHAWGLAFDINTAENPRGSTPTLDLRVVAIFERWGFRWGGRWSPPDGHHFELGAIIEGLG